MVRHESPAWKPSSTSFPQSFLPSYSGTPHSSSWYALIRASPSAQEHRFGMEMMMAHVSEIARTLGFVSHGLAIRTFIEADALEVSEVWREVFAYADARNQPERIIADKL